MSRILSPKEAMEFIDGALLPIFPDEVIDTAYLALAKADPKVVIKNRTEWGTYTFTCPNCHVELTGNWRHCSNCGQKLRWEE